MFLQEKLRLEQQLMGAWLLKEELRIKASKQIYHQVTRVEFNHLISQTTILIITQSPPFLILDKIQLRDKTKG